MRRHKYNAKKTTVDGIVFDSKAEAARYRELRLLQATGEICNLELQPAFVLLKAFKGSDGERHRGIKYVADFQYTEAGKTVVEDVKGVQTDVWRLKKKLFLYHYPQYELRVVS